MITISDKAKAVVALCEEKENLNKEAMKTNLRIQELIKQHEYEMKMLSDYQKDILMKMVEVDIAVEQLLKG